MLSTENIINIFTNIMLVFIFSSIIRIGNILIEIKNEMNRRKNIIPTKRVE